MATKVYKNDAPLAFPTNFDLLVPYFFLGLSQFLKSGIGIDPPILLFYPHSVSDFYDILFVFFSRL